MQAGLGPCISPRSHDSSVCSGQTEWQASMLEANLLPGPSGGVAASPSAQQVLSM